MKELEKILVEIEQKKCEHIDKNYIFGSGDIVNGLDMAMEIIRKHMNDGWVSVEERLPGENGFYIATMDGEIVGQKRVVRRTCGI